jgi:galactose-1-phosphate uridylyltransferase
MMIETLYRKELSKLKYLDPANRFQVKEITLEIRHDSITGNVCRILPSRYRKPLKPDIQLYLERSPESLCPFCPDLIDKTTPRFTPDVHPQGNFKRGNAVLFPNAFPHDMFNAVAIFSEKHFAGLNDLTVDYMMDGFLVCMDYFDRIKTLHPTLHFCSINWNYMPPSGGGLLHPHVQTVMGEAPTRLVGTMYDRARDYFKESGGNLWRDIVALEKKRGERYIAGNKGIDWLTSFSPRGMAGEIWFCFAERRSIFSLSNQDFRDLLDGFTRLWSFFERRNWISFNLALFGTLEDDDHLWIQGRILPRFIIFPLEASDVNYFEKLHDEVICPVIPEEMCTELKEIFNE